MIKVIRSDKSNRGSFDFTIPSLHLCGKSRQPLLDACRMAKQAGADTEQEIGLFRNGRSEADISVNVEKGSKLSVQELKAGSAPVFRPFIEFEGIL